MKIKTETRYEADWVADVKVETRGQTCNATRKVLTKGICPVILTVDQTRRITNALRRGEEVRFKHNGLDSIRLYPCLDKEYKTMFVAAQTMGDFRTETYKGIKFSIAKRRRKNEREWTAEDYKKRAEKVREFQRDKYHMAVTPDPFVTCPKCGFEFRVGKPKAA